MLAALATSLHVASAAARVHLRARVIVASAAAAPQRVLAYGDSLTAGTFNMDEPDQLYPYAPHLEAALCGGAVVRHLGLPGATAAVAV